MEHRLLVEVGSAEQRLAGLRKVGLPRIYPRHDLAELPRHASNLPCVIQQHPKRGCRAVDCERWQRNLDGLFSGVAVVEGAAAVCADVPASANRWRIPRVQGAEPVPRFGRIVHLLVCVQDTP